MKTKNLIKHPLYLLFTFLTIIMLNINYLHAQAITISVCDNGGFEQDFLHYTGEKAVFKFGSLSCTPLKSDSLTPVVFSSASLPTTRRFEIVTSGVDTLVDINRTKFGSKALRLNSRFGHSNDSCRGDYGVDRIIKEFKVTEETRNFTVWYALVLENPGNHGDRQPFFNIECDLAPDDDLCFDASILNCEQAPMDTICNYDSLDVLNWTCHRIRIPKSEVGNIATLEITVSDCGAGEHFGYAYIDGICEDCDSSALGSFELDSIINICSTDETTICGHYTLPLLCNQDWSVDSIVAPGYEIENLSIDTVNHTFCFDFLSSNFGILDDCLEVYVDAYFSDGTRSLPSISSNFIDVCLDDFGFVDSLTVSDCYDNGTDDNYSDDYYYVTIGINNAIGKSWDIYRDLNNPYPDESGYHFLASDTGNATITLGPFLIQEGSWNAEITIDSNFCTQILLITPPDYCGKCDEFNDVVIDSIKCISGSPDEWSFDLYVPGSGNFYVNNELSSYSEGTTHTFTFDDVADGCEKFVLKTLFVLGCEITFYVCPPKPCSVTCDIEARVESLSCTYSGGVVSYNVQLDVNDVSGKYECYVVTKLDGTTVLDGPTALPTSQSIGPYTETEGIYLTFYLCGNSDCITGCTTPDCYKSFYIATPDNSRCTTPLILGNETIHAINSMEVTVIPNPIQNDLLTIKSEMSHTFFEIFSIDGQLIHRDNFIGTNYNYKINLHNGIYILQYIGSNGVKYSYKFVKM